MYSRVDAQPLGQREPLGVQALAHLRRRRERVLGRDVVAVGAEAAEVGRAGRAPARATSPTGSAAPGCRRPAAAGAPRRSAASCPRSSTAHAHSGASQLRRRPRRRCASTRRRRRRRSRPARARSSSGAGRSSGGSPPGCGRARRARSASASSDAIRSSSVSPMPTRIPLVNGIFSSPAAAIVSSRRAGCLVGDPWWRDSARVDRLEHQPLRGGHLAQPREVLALERRRGSCAAAARARARARRPRRRRR